MKRRNSKKSKSKQRKRSGPSKPPGGKPPVDLLGEPEIPLPDAFLEEARKETKRQLLSDHIETINLLRNEKRFTFRAIAEWLSARGIATDHSSVYRAYLSAVPLDQRHPDEDWEDLEPE
jgi:hypothetical protein